MGFSGKLNRPRYQNWFSCDHVPEPGLSSAPLITVGIVGIICYITAMFFSLKDGFRIAEIGDHLAAYGSVVLLLVDFSYIFYTLKIMFCIKSNTFPTWPEVRDLRDTVMRLTSCFIVGLSLILVAYDWFTEFGHIKETAVSLLETTEGSLKNNLTDSLRNNLTDFVTNNNTLDENSDEFPLDQFRPADRVYIPEILSNATEEVEALINKTLNKHTTREEDHRSYTRDNPPFVSLFFSSFSFCIAGATIIIAVIFEKKCADALAVLILRHSDDPCSDETERLLPARYRRLVPPHFETTEATGMLSVDESNIASTSSPRVCSQEHARFSSYGSEGDSSVSRRVHFHEPSRLVNLYPHYGSGTRHYWCSVCNSTLAPSPKLQDRPMSLSTTEAKKSSAVDLPENGVIGQASSSSQASKDNFPVDVVVHAEGSQPPVSRKAEAELESETAATDTAEAATPKGTLPQNYSILQASHEHKATELFQSADTVHEGDYIEMTEI
ncbi:uncharacterized protein [Macrobrachium rosenbergii]|uniref:uncharacterized protein n=1 Tax=Macrobrachium rosenbergii TaxID=79674 RepID=UPI0034D5EF15